MWFNIVLHNHGGIEEAGRLGPLIDYMRQCLSICGHETTVVYDQLYEDAINLYFEHFIDAGQLGEMAWFKKTTGARIGTIATELMVKGTIPYARHGMYVVYADDREERIKARLDGFDDALKHMDFLWSFLPRTAENYAGAVPLSAYFPVGSTGASNLLALRSPKDLDIIFFGTWTPHRAGILDRFAERGVVVTTAGPGFPAGHLPDALLDSMMNRAKIALNLTLANSSKMTNGIDPRFASCMRIKALLDRNVAIVSEDIPLDNPYADFMTTTTIDQMVDACIALLGSDHWKEIGAANAAQFHQQMDVNRVCAPVIDQTLSALAIR